MGRGAGATRGRKKEEQERGDTDLVNLGQRLHVGAMQHTQRQADHLQVLATRRRADGPGLGPHVKDDGLLQPRDQEVGALVDHLLLHTGNPVKDDGAGAALDVVDGLLRNKEGKGGRACQLGHVAQSQ